MPTLKGSAKISSVGKDNIKPYFYVFSALINLNFIKQAARRNKYFRGSFTDV